MEEFGGHFLQKFTGLKPNHYSILKDDQQKLSAKDVVNFLRNFFNELPGSNFFGKTLLFFRYGGINATNAVNLQAKRC